jgi:hypothetical protein
MQICPLKFSNPNQPQSCNQNCAWLMSTGMCALAQIASSLSVIENEMEKIKK